MTDIRQRLLLAFIGVALGIVVVFGAMSYHIALNSSAEKEAQIIRHFTEEQADKLAHTLSWPPDKQALGASLWLNPDNDHIMTIIDERGDTLAGPNLADIFGEDALPFARDHALTEHGFEGHFHGAHGPVFWISAPIAGTPFNLLSVHHSRMPVASLFEHLGTQLLISAALILCLAVWGALLITKLITKRLNKQHDTLVHQATHDGLTGLANRDRLQRRLSELTTDKQGGPDTLALLVMDLDRFKEINDTLGHHLGDEVLKEVAIRLQKTLPKADATVRTGGDEYAILLSDTDAQAAVAAARQIQDAVNRPINLDGIDITPHTSIGIALYPEHGAEPGTLIRRAEVAMYNAKRRGLDHIIYAQELDPYNVRQLSLAGELRNAIDNNQLILYYQPKADLHSQTTTGVEALLRWKHPVHGFVPPGDFIQLAEQSDLIRRITYWVIDEALLQCRAWRQMGISLNVAVNLSPRNLHDPGLTAKIAGLLAKWSVPAEQLTLEITENAIMIDPERALNILTRLNGMGIQISIDDFGTGYSSLVYLKKLPVNQIKIDRSFVMDMTSDENDAIIVRSTIDLGHNMGCHVVAEGVEDKDTLECLKALGCDHAQGYYLSRPLPADELTTWLTQSSWGLDRETAPRRYAAAR